MEMSQYRGDGALLTQFIAAVVAYHRVVGSIVQVPEGERVGIVIPACKTLKTCGAVAQCMWGWCC